MKGLRKDNPLNQGLKHLDELPLEYQQQIEKR